MQKLIAIGDWKIPSAWFRACGVIGLLLAIGDTVGADTGNFWLIAVGVAVFGELKILDRLKAWAMSQGANYGSFLILLAVSTTLASLMATTPWLLTV